MGTPKSSLQDLKDSKPPAAATYKATSLERQQEARSKPGGGSVVIVVVVFGQRTDHLLRCPGELLKDSEEDAAGPQDRNTAAGSKRHLEWDSSPSDGAV